MPIKNNEFNSNIKQSPPLSTLTGEVPDTSDAPPAAVDTGPLEHQQGSTFNIPISIRFTHSPSISGQPDRNPENPPTQQSQTTGTTTASNAPHLAGPQSRRSPRLIPKMTPVSGKLSKQLHCNENRFRSPDIPAPGGPPGRTLSRETPTHQQQRVRRDLSPVPGCSWHPVRFRPSRKPVVTNRDTHFPVPALTGDVPPYSDAPPATAGAGGPGTSRKTIPKPTRNETHKTTDTTPADPLLYLPRSLEGTYARPPINNCNKNYPLNTNKAHEADSFLSREKASSPAPALSADVPALTDEPSAAAGAGGPDHHRVSLITPYSHQDQSYGSESFPGSPPRSPNSVSMTNSTGSEYSTLVVQWNINGLRNNLGDLQNIIAGTEPLCLAIQQTHLHTGVDPTPWFGNR
ncbi:mucin-2-like [Topomyia yanbarensis]|uniref:mucin-2-like n=1 Tax=Topomyia yanbarensis TaxID=2498891 RepID=UPI00273C526D|nr:mucin-2-like [Topomyia yanbarensis]